MASKPALPVLFLVLPPVFQAFTIALRPSLPLRLLAFSVFGFASCYAAVTYTKGDLFPDYIQGSAFGIGIAHALHFLLIADPMVDFRRDGETEPPAKRSIWGRVYWTFGLQHGLRGVGWNYRVCAPVSGHAVLTRICSCLIRRHRLRRSRGSSW